MDKKVFYLAILFITIFIAPNALQSNEIYKMVMRDYDILKQTRKITPSSAVNYQRIVNVEERILKQIVDQNEMYQLKRSKKPDRKKNRRTHQSSQSKNSNKKKKGKKEKSFLSKLNLRGEKPKYWKKSAKNFSINELEKENQNEEPIITQEKEKKNYNSYNKKEINKNTYHYSRRLLITQSNNQTRYQYSNDNYNNQRNNSNANNNNYNTYSYSDSHQDNHFSVYLSQLQPVQGSVLTVYIKAKYPFKKLEGYFGSKKIYFNKIKPNLYRGFIGIDLFEKPGNTNFILRMTNFNNEKTRYKTYLKIRGKHYILNKKRKPQNHYSKRNDNKKVRGVLLTFSQKKSKLLTHPKRLKERQYFNHIFKQRTSHQYWKGGFHYPIQGTNKYVYSYGRLRTYYTNHQIIYGRHRGIDIPRAKGTYVKAVNHGKVVVAGFYPIRGYAVVLDHGQGIYSAYYHLSKIDAKKGAFVKKGELIGRVGTTGLSTGHHLHWEMYVNGINVNPAYWVSRRTTHYRYAYSLKKNIQLVYHHSAPKNKERKQARQKNSYQKDGVVFKKPVDQF